MASLATLPEDLLHPICEYLDIASLKSLSLSARTISAVHQRYCYREISITASSGDQSKKLSFLDRLESQDKLKYVYYLKIDDTRSRSPEGSGVLKRVVFEMLPRLVALRTVTWCIQREHDHEFEDILQNFELPSKTNLFIECMPPVYSGYASALQVLKNAPNYTNLSSVQLQAVFLQPEFNTSLKGMLSRCHQLRSLRLVVKPHRDVVADLSLDWSPAEVSTFAPLKELEFMHDRIRPGALECWAQYGNWTKLQVLRVHDTEFLNLLSGRTPMLRALSVGSHRGLQEFLSHTPDLLSLTLTRKRPLSSAQDAHATMNELISIRDMLALPFARKLKSLAIRMDAPPYGVNGFSPINLSELPTLCPNLTSLTFSIHQVLGSAATEVDLYDWMNMAAKALKSLPHLRRFEVVMPRMVKCSKDFCGVTCITLSHVEELWNKIKPFGTQLSGVCITASLFHHRSLEIESSSFDEPPRYPPSGLLHFVAALCEKDTDAAQGLYTVKCLELIEAEASLAIGDYFTLCESGNSLDAQFAVENLRLLVEYGAINRTYLPDPSRW